MSVVIETTLGDITVDLFTAERPRGCLNFLKLCKLKYYNFNLFHTIERDFIAQTGDPIGAGNGGESVWGVVEGPHKRFFEAESLPKIKHTNPGLLSLVSVGKFMVGSQFFFTLGSDLTSLDGIHCVIGEVVEGHEVLRMLNEAIVDEKFRPYQDIRVTHTVILDDPFSDPRGFQVPSRSPSPTAERLQNGRIGADEDIDDTEGKTLEEIQEMLAEREAKARATILEIVGDLPDADIAPPENVLFVCKLNPVTTDDDLEIIFSRFGKVKSCEVIRDKVSGDSLQYAFVEFEEQKSCEAAYFKMDNVLIDDRRIHVDFSQSVSKVQWRGKGRGVVHADERDRKLDFNNLKNDRGEERRRYTEQRDRSRSPMGKFKNEGPTERRYNSGNGNSDNRKRSPNGRESPELRRRSPEHKYPGGSRRDNRYERRPNHEDDKRHRPPPAERWRSHYERRGRPQYNVNYRQHSPPYERRHSPPNKRTQYSPNQRGRSPADGRRSADRKRLSDGRSDFPPRDMRDNRTNNYRNPRGGFRQDRNFNSFSWRGGRGYQPSFPTARTERRDDSDAHPIATKTKSKDHKKSKKRKKAVSSSSSSSSESETDSSSTSTSASSSSSEEEKRRKAKKLKKKDQKTKKRPKKKSKRRSSSSSD